MATKKAFYLETPKALPAPRIHTHSHCSGISSSLKDSPAFLSPAPLWLEHLLHPQVLERLAGLLEAEVILCSGSCALGLIHLGFNVTLGFLGCVMQWGGSQVRATALAGARALLRKQRPWTSYFCL